MEAGRRIETLPFYEGAIFYSPGGEFKIKKREEKWIETQPGSEEKRYAYLVVDKKGQEFTVSQEILEERIENKLITFDWMKKKELKTN